MSLTNNNNPTSSQVFKLLNSWRHLPSYSLEPRVTPYFALFLRDILCTRFGRIHEILIPEFPLHIHTICSEKERVELNLRAGPHQSNNVDYVAFSEDKKTVYMVELKTDINSISDTQRGYLRRARDTEFLTLVKRIKQIAPESEQKQKYVHLLHLLADPRLALVNSQGLDRVNECSFPTVTRGYKKAISNLEISSENFLKTIVVFIQPKPDKKNQANDENGFDYFYFDEIADTVEGKDELGDLFALYLRRWVSVAGSESPS